MGQTGSFTSYEDALLKETKERAYEVPESAETGTTNTIRSFEGKDGFVGYLKTMDEDEKTEIELDTAWKLFKYVLKSNFV